MYTVRWDKFEYSPVQFGLWRIAFGLYLLYYFLALMPYGAELYSNEGPFTAELFSHHYTIFPFSAFSLASPGAVRTLLIVCSLLSIFITLGVARRTSAFLIWLSLTWMINRNYWTDSPEFGFVNWLVAALIFIPKGESLTIAAKDPGWRMPKNFYWGAWIVLAFGYFYAGASKFSSKDPAWMDGTAMLYVLSRNNARFTWFGDFFEHLPLFMFRMMTWAALILQNMAGLFIYFRQARPWWWLAATGIHLSLLFFANLPQLTWGMVFFHFFLFDMQWVRWTFAHFNLKYPLVFSPRTKKVPGAKPPRKSRAS